MQRSHDPPAPPAVRCGVRAHAGLVLAAEEVPALRQRPGPAPGRTLPASFLKQADEQTVAGLVAVYRALRDHEVDAAGLGEWGALAAPELFGRTAMAPALKGFAEEGAWGVSPHVIAHRSLHALSGTVSQALGLHGPNFGVGGGPGAAAEALLAAAALLADGRLPGLWLVLTAGEDAPGGAGLHWQAAALALVPDRGGAARGLTLEVGAAPAAGAEDWPALTLPALRAALAAAPRPACWRLGAGGWARLAAGAEGRP